MEMGSVNGAPSIAEVWIELRIFFDFWWCLICGKMDMFLIEGANKEKENRGH
jgi:hypothetical protein